MSSFSSSLRIFRYCTFVIVTGLTLFSGLSCKKNIDTPEHPPSLEDLTVPADFTWTTSTRYTLQVNVTGDGEGKTLRLYEKNGSLLDAGTVLNSRIIFDFQVENAIDTVRIYAPSTRISQYLRKDAGQTTFTMSSGLKAAPQVVSDFAAGFNGSNQYIQVDNGASGAIVVQYPFTSAPGSEPRATARKITIWPWSTLPTPTLPPSITGSTSGNMNRTFTKPG